ncbi:class I SAM-dependent methyltransferase [Myxacorys almedinensis]|uniref:Methyltransferase domain-containing protein n=1 Tax=Myxacorys almedinensis A TaxID=2690445 RepID=A0A8J7Z2E6_9CYAN|nr:class I SAM-dependent methyltransferase [Myxacorys almedinensis]NDJ18787.1 methyltransferase domain-containing protein [Myxacorys almedinensis A]
MSKPEKRHNWMLDEMKSAGRENLDAEHASQYDFKEDANVIEKLALIKRLGLNEKSEVVDIGAGIGQFTLAVASVCARVVAADVSPVMMNVLKTKVSTSRLPNIEIIQSGFLTYEHQGRQADFVYSRYALHHLPDFWKALALLRMLCIQQMASSPDMLLVQSEQVEPLVSE